jgi:hypothetical protein
MSIAFRLRYALGLIPSADQLDARWEKLIKMRDDLDQMENSNELKQYEELKTLIDSSAFQHNKREVEALQFSGSKEENLILEHKALAKSPAIRNYRKVENSPQLKRLHTILEGSDLQRYLTLQKEIESSDFKSRRAGQRKKEFIKTPDYVVFKEFSELSKSGDIRFWGKFSQSDSYNSYLNTVGSKELKRLDELNELMSSTDFTGRVAYLKDKKRYLKSEGYKSIVTFKELDKSNFMADYRKLKKARELDFFEKWEIKLDENFLAKELNTQHWQPENWWGFRLAGTSFSQEGEMQCYNGHKNIQLNSNTLSLVAKKEKTMGKVWNPSVGLIPKQYEYSAAILNSADFFRLKEGVVEAKVRFKKDATITSAFSLTGEKPFPQIDLFRSTKNGVGMGILEKQGTKSSKYLRLSGLNDQLYHVFRLELFNGQLVWKINGFEVYRNTTSLNEPLFFNLLTSLHGEVNEHLLPHRFEIDWIRCFAPKS